MLRPFRLAPLWLAIGAALVAAVIYASLAETLPDYLQIEGNLKLNHILAYAVLMLYFAQLPASPKMACLIAGVFGVMGVILEYLQGMTVYRTFSYYDMFANCMGISAGFMLSKTPIVHLISYLDRKITAHF